MGQVHLLQKNIIKLKEKKGFVHVLVDMAFKYLIFYYYYYLPSFSSALT